MRSRRLPFAPLEHVIGGIELDREPCRDRPKQMARLFGVDTRQVYRWRHDGITIPQADRLCHLIERHPAEIWREWDPAVNELEVGAA